MSNDSKASRLASIADAAGRFKRPTVDVVLKISLAAAAILAAIALAYYFLIYVPARDQKAAAERAHQASLAAQTQRDALARQAKEQTDKVATIKAALVACLSTADSDYAANWSHACEARGLKGGCSLPVYETDAISTTRENAKARCTDEAKYGLAPPR